MTTTIEPATQPQAGSHDPERYTHIIYTPGRKAAAAITEAQVCGYELEALCGKRWIPSRDPKKHPVCPTCQEIYNRNKEQS